MSNPIVVKNYKILVSFNSYYSNQIKDIEIQLPILPRVGEWFFAEDLFNVTQLEEFEDRSSSQGVFYVREIWHSIEDGIQVIILHMALTEKDGGFYAKHFR